MDIQNDFLGLCRVTDIHKTIIKKVGSLDLDGIYKKYCDKYIAKINSEIEEVKKADFFDTEEERENMIKDYEKEIEYAEVLFFWLQENKDVDLKESKVFNPVTKESYVVKNKTSKKEDNKKIRGLWRN